MQKSTMKGIRKIVAATLAASALLCGCQLVPNDKPAGEVIEQVRNAC